MDLSVLGFPAWVGRHAQLAHDREPRKAEYLAPIGAFVQERCGVPMQWTAIVGGVQQYIDVDAEAHRPRSLMASRSACLSARSTRARIGRAIHVKTSGAGCEPRSRVVASARASRSDSALALTPPQALQLLKDRIINVDGGAHDQ